MITTTRMSMFCALAALSLCFESAAYARPTPDAQATCVAILTTVRGAGRAQAYMVNEALGTLRAEVAYTEANKSTWSYPQASMGISERSFSLNVDAQISKLKSKSLSLARWEEVAQNLGTFKTGHVSFAHTVEGREEVTEFLAKLKTDIEALNARVEPTIKRQKFWDVQRKISAVLRSIVPAGSLLAAAGGASLITGLDMTESNNLVGAATLWLSTLGARETVEVLPWWAAKVSKKAQRYLDERSSYRTLHFTEGLETMASASAIGYPGWRSVHLVVPVSEQLAEEILRSREVESDDPNYDPLKLISALTVNSNIAQRRMQSYAFRWATVDLFLSVSEKGKPTLVIAGGLQKDYIIAPKKKPKARRETPVLQKEFGLIPQLVPVRY